MICLISSFLISVSGQAQDSDKILDWKTESTLRTHLIREMHRQYDLRRLELAAALKTENGVAAYREQCRKKYIQLLGDLPHSAPLNARVMRKMIYDGYSVENIIYESRPGHHVTANLYLPEGSGPFPAALIFCGHEMTSKATESYQKTAILFVLNGFAALVVDPVSQGERVQCTDSSGERILRGSTTEHTLLNAGTNLVGSSIVAWELFDNVRSLDYMVSRPEVDADRVGCLGNSGGGAQTAYFIGYDNRIKVAAPCSNIASRERNYELSGTGDGCQQIPSEGREQLEIADFLVMFAPKPLLILAGKYDFVDYTGTETAYLELKQVYNALGTPENLRLFTFDDGHGISKPKREEAVRWFRQWLCADSLPVSEGDIGVHDEESTLCTATGQVNSFFEDERNVQDFTMQRAVELSGDRAVFIRRSSHAAIRAKLKELLAIKGGDFTVETETVSIEQHSGYRLTTFILRRRGEVPLPCIAYLPDKINPRGRVVIWLNESGKSKITPDLSLIMPQILAGNPVLLADLRGMGETAEKPEANDPKYYNREYHNAVMSLHIGSPLPGQRTEDVLTLLKYISDTPQIADLSVKIIASGSAGPVALYASILSDAITDLEISGSPRSFLEILEQPMGKDWYSYVVPDILRYFDLPDLAGVRPGAVIGYTHRDATGKEPVPIKPYVSEVWTPDRGGGTYINPILHADYSDPDVIRAGDDYYMTTSSFNCVPGLPVLHSKDLVGWEITGYALPSLKPESDFSKPVHGGGVWAPCIRYHNNEFYIYYPDPERGIFLVRAKDPSGPWSEPLLVKEGKGLIDPSPLWDDDGRAYLVHAFAGSRAGIKSILVVSSMNDEGTIASNDAVLVFDGHKDQPTVEGPKFYKRNGYYYIFAPAGGVTNGWQLVLRSENIYGPYVKRIVLHQGNTAVNGPHQGAWVTTQTGEDWFIHFQDKEAYGRIVHLQPMKWVDDWPVIGTDQNNDGIGEPVNGYKKPNIAGRYPAVTPMESDEFNGPAPGLQWQWHANPVVTWGLPAVSEGFYRLNCLPRPENYWNLWNIPNLMLQKFPAEEFTATTSMTFNAGSDGEEAGFVVMGIDYQYISLKRVGGKLMLRVVRCKDAENGGEEEQLFSSEVSNPEIILRINVGSSALCSFSYSTDGNEFIRAGEEFRSRPGRWIGAKIGYFALRDGITNDAGSADIDWFRITKK